MEIQVNIVETLAANDPIVPFSGWRYGVLFALLAAMTICSVRVVKPLWAVAMIMGLTCIDSLATLWLFAHEQL